MGYVCHVQTWLRVGCHDSMEGTKSTNAIDGGISLVAWRMAPLVGDTARIVTLSNLAVPPVYWNAQITSLLWSYAAAQYQLFLHHQPQQDYIALHLLTDRVIYLIVCGVVWCGVIPSSANEEL
jgi:hypothetical protein